MKGVIHSLLKTQHLKKIFRQKINRDVIKETRELTAEPEVQEIIKVARKMQTHLMQIWNPNGDEIPLVSHMGLVSMDTDTAQKKIVPLVWIFKKNLECEQKNKSGKYVNGK